MIQNVGGNNRHLDRSDDSDIDLLAILSVLWLRKWLVLLFVLVAVGIGGFYAFRIAEPQFYSVTRIVYESEDLSILNVGSFVTGEANETSALNTELEIVRSRRLVGLLVDALELVDDPEFNPTLAQPNLYSVANLKEQINLLLGSENKVEELTEQEILNVTIDEVRAAISVSPLRDTYLFSIGVTTSSPAKSIRIVNTLADLYVKDQVAFKLEATAFAVDWLSERATTLEAELRTWEERVRVLRSSSELVSEEAIEVLNLRIKSLRDQQQRNLEAEQSLAEQHSQLLALIEAGDAESVLEITADPVLNRLLGQSDPGTALIDRQLQTLASRSQAELDRSRARSETLAGSIKTLEAEFTQQNADLLTLNNLLRELETTRVLYETFLLRLKEASAQLGLQRPDSRILSASTRGHQVAPRRARILAFSMVLGAVLGIGLVVLQSLIQRGFRATEELETMTGYPVLGELPVMPIRSRARLLKYIKNNPTAPSAEAMRNMRTTIMMQSEAPPKVILVSSSVPGESKTTTSIQMAKQLTDLKKRVLLIDGDIRRMSLGVYFPPRTNSNSMTKVLKGDVPLDQAVIPSGLGFDVLLAGKTNENPADLLIQADMETFFGQVSESYDMILIDSPPVLAVPDAKILARFADAVLYAVAWNDTGKNQVVNGLRQFRDIGAPVYGIVLTKIDIARAQAYGYGAYGTYGKGYHNV